MKGDRSTDGVAEAQGGGRRAVATYTLVEAAKFDEVDPQAWLADALAACRIIQPNALPNCCPGTGSNSSSKTRRA
jgi:hypothetical protein